MAVKSFVFALVLLSVTGVTAEQQAESKADIHAEQMVAFVDVNVVPMDREHILARQTVIVHGDRIAEIGPVEATDVPEDARRVDGRDKYVMPGLADMHVHPGHPDQLILLIANGVTTIRNMWGFPEEHLVWRKQIEKGDLLGPTIYTTGPILDGNPPSWPGSEVVETAEAARKAVAAHREAGYDFIKVLSGVSAEVYEAIIAAARTHEIHVVGHVPDAVGLDKVLTSGQYSIEHLSGFSIALQSDSSPLLDSSKPRLDKWVWEHMDEHKIPQLVSKVREAGTWICPTLGTSQNFRLASEVERALIRPEMRYVRPNTLSWWKKPSVPADMIESLRRSDKARKKVTKALYDGGVQLLLGTDSPAPFSVHGFATHQELLHLVDAGLTPFEAIKTTTRNAAEFLGALDEFGTVALGLRADLILVEGNPLEDVANVAQRAGVMLRGEWLPDTKLQAMLKTLAASYKQKEAKKQEK